MVTLDDLETDLDELGIEELEDGTYIYYGEEYSEEDLVTRLIEEDRVQIASARGFVDIEDLDLNFPVWVYEDDDEEY